MAEPDVSDEMTDDELAEALADFNDDELAELADQTEAETATRARIGWDALVAKLMGRGHSKASAERIAHHVAVRKYGRAGLAALAAEGRAKAKLKKAAMRSQAGDGGDYYSRVWTLDDIEILRGGKGGDGRTVAAYAATFGKRAEIKDMHGHYYEQIHRSAFNRAISHGIEGRVTVLYNHGFDLSGNPSGLGSVPIGSPLEIKADDRGLYTVTRFNRSELADAVLHAIDNGDIRGYSFRGRVFQSDPPRMPRIQRGGQLPTITRMELGLSEYGPTPIPFYADAGIVAVRSAALADAQRLPYRERIVIARALLADDDTQTTDSTREPDDVPDEGTEATTTPEPDEPETDPVDASLTPSDEGLETEDPDEADQADEPLPPVTEAARSMSGADIRRRARAALILRTAAGRGGK